MTTEQKRSRTWCRWLADVGDVLRMVFSWRGVGRRRAQDSRQASAELLEQQERSLRALRLEVGRRLNGKGLEGYVGRYTVLWRLDVGPALTMRGADALRWILSRIEDEAAENLAHDHWHPDVAGPLQVLVLALRQALERAGEGTAWVPATRGRR